MWWHGMNGYGWGWGVGIVFMALFWIALILLVVWAVRAASARSPGSHPPAPPLETPLEILQRRYARGEIGKAEYEEKRRDLS